jgi:hypothetical protein
MISVDTRFSWYYTFKYLQMHCINYLVQVYHDIRVEPKGEYLFDIHGLHYVQVYSKRFVTKQSELPK